MVALIAMVTVAELLLGEAVINSDSSDADAIARLNLRGQR
jgi:hypothetical protein